MTPFPQLKTGAVAQYPLTRALRFQNQVLRFLDGSEQRYRDAGGARRRWAIRLDLLDEGEMAAIEAFFEANEGAFGSFTFTDPWDAEAYTHCRLEGDVLELAATGEMRGSTTVTVVQESR